MANSMDVVKIKFGAVQTENMDEQSAKEAKSKIRTLTLPEFIYPENFPDNPPLNLSENEKNLQYALRLIYELNGKEPPLYREFPTFRQDEDPLIIDITTSGLSKDKNALAEYSIFENVVRVKKADDPSYLVLLLAHELKHAEQATPEALALENQIAPRAFFGDIIENAYTWHQLQFLSEAQAYATNARAYYEIFGHTDDSRMTGVKTYEMISKKYTDASGHKDDKKIEEEMISFILGKLYVSPYKDGCDMRAPIGEDDKGLDCIPEGFHLSQNLMKKLNEAPRTARSFRGKLFQAKRNNHLDEYIRLLHEGVDEKMPDDYGKVLEYIFENASLKQIQDVLTLKRTDRQYMFDLEKFREFCEHYSHVFGNAAPDVLKYLTKSTRDGERFLSSKNIADILTLKTEHPDDFRKCVAAISDSEGHLPITGDDLISFNGCNDLFNQVYGTGESLNNMAQLLPQILKLTGSDGKTLAREEQFARALGYWHWRGDENDIKMFLDTIKDEKGHLPILREAFDINTEKGDKHNQLLYCLINPDVSEKHRQTDERFKKILPVLMSLKDKEGRLIISKENIDSYPDDAPFAAVIKSYGKSRKLAQVLSKKVRQEETSSDKKQVPLSVLKKRNTPQAGE